MVPRLMISLPLEADEPIPLDDAMALWNEIVRTAYACGFSPEGASVEYEGFDP